MGHKLPAEWKPLDAGICDLWYQVDFGVDNGWGNIGINKVNCFLESICRMILIQVEHGDGLLSRTFMNLLFDLLVVCYSMVLP